MNISDTIKTIDGKGEGTLEEAMELLLPMLEVARMDQFKDHPALPLPWQWAVEVKGILFIQTDPGGDQYPLANIRFHPERIQALPEGDRVALEKIVNKQIMRFYQLATEHELLLDLLI